jgi:hypothetical protein
VAVQQWQLSSEIVTRRETVNGQHGNYGKEREKLQIDQAKLQPSLVDD